MTEVMRATKSFYFSSTGCLRTSRARKRVYNYFRANGFSLAAHSREADILVVDTCAYCLKTEQDSLALVAGLVEQKNRDAKVVVIGCITKINPDSLSGLGDVVMMTPQTMACLDQLINATVPFKSINPDGVVWMPGDLQRAYGASHCSRLLPKPFKVWTLRMLRRIFPFTWKTKFPNLYKKIRLASFELARDVLVGEESLRQGIYHLEVATGCVSHCSYCAVRNVWGEMTSRPMEDIISEFEQALKAGYQIFALDAQDLGAYGRDRGDNIMYLLEKIFAVEGAYRLMLHDFNPQWLVKFYPQLVALLQKNAKRIVYIDIPVQSGSNDILRRMRRPYTIEPVAACISDLKQQIPGMAIEVDIMAGFPGESEADFKRSLDFLKSLKKFRPVFLWTSGYTDRPGTEAQGMAGKMDPQVIEQRLHRCDALAWRYGFFTGDAISLLHQGMRQVGLSK